MARGYDRDHTNVQLLSVFIGVSLNRKWKSHGKKSNQIEFYSCMVHQWGDCETSKNNNFCLEVRNLLNDLKIPFFNLPLRII